MNRTMRLASGSLVRVAGAVKVISVRSGRDWRKSLWPTTVIMASADLGRLTALGVLSAAPTIGQTNNPKSNSVRMGNFVEELRYATGLAGCLEFSSPT